MTTLVSKFITKTLCESQGSLDFRRLNERLSQSYTAADSVLQRVLFDDGKIAIQEGRQKAAGNQILGPDSVVVAKTNLRLCQRKECSHCDGLHLCRYFVCGGCSFGHRCKNPHSLAFAHNAEILKRHGLDELSEKQLFQLLMQNDPYLLPEICPHYNKGDGVHGSCKFTTSCTKLHICQHYLQDDCKFGNSCKRTHRFNVNGTKIFQGFSQENIANLHQIYRNKFIIMKQERPSTAAPVVPPPPSYNKPATPATTTCPSKPMSDADRNEICLFFIRRHCSFKDKCARVHWHLPYRWQVLHSDGVTWKDLPNMEDIEKAYCDPERDTNVTNLPSPSSLGLFRFLSIQSSAASEPAVDFIVMTYQGSPVRRLSTASSGSKPPHFILTTEWLWYWKDDNGKWLEFGQGDADTQASVTSQTLENVYLADRDTEIPFGAGKQQYILHFKDVAGGRHMYQQNVKHKTKREVRRRPRFVSAQDVEAKLRSVSSHSVSSSAADGVPPHWDKNALPDLGHKLVPLVKSAKEYNMIEVLFKRTMCQSRINSIQRIQNPSLWKVFQWQKEQMMKRNGGKTVEQQYLFHGTDESLIEAICEQNFDWRMCGVHGTAYGKGSYFARDASYSDKYARTKNSVNKIMIAALVLVGDYTKGSSSYVRPPLKRSSKALFDSCVDRESDPSIYVIFEKQQIYPEYLINYS